MLRTGRNRPREKWLPRSIPGAACAQRVLASSWFTGLKAPKFDDDVASFPFFQKLERTLSCEGFAFRSQPSRNIRALDRLLQNGPKLFKIPQLARAPGYSGPLPVLHGSQAHTKGMAHFGLGQSEMFTQLPGTISRRDLAISWPGSSR